MIKKNNTKEFFKPTRGKFIFLILIFLLMFFIGFYFLALCDPCPCLRSAGSPFKFLEEIVSGPSLLSSELVYDCGVRTANFSLFYLIIDGIFWYLIICLVSFLYKKIKPKKNKK